MNIANILDLSNKIINGAYVNINSFTTTVQNVIINRYVYDSDYTIHYPVIKAAIDKISEKNIIVDFIKFHKIYENDIANYNKNVKRQHFLDNRIFMINRYLLSEIILKTFNIELLTYILYTHEVALTIYFIKTTKQKNYSLALDEKNTLMGLYKKYFEELDEDYSLIYFHSFIIEIDYNNENYIFIEILYNKIKNNLSTVDNIEIFKKIINGKYYELLKNIILKIKNNNNFMSHYIHNLNNFNSLIYLFGHDQKKIDILIKYFNMPITEDLIILLIKKKYIADVDAKINNNILEQCSIHGYYPYNIDFAPNDVVMSIESRKQYNVQKFKSFHLAGGIITLEHLKNACQVRYNEEMIKYIINSGIKPTDTCLTIFKNAYDNTIFNNFIDCYLSSEPLKDNNEKFIKLNEQNIFSIEKKEIKNENEIEDIKVNEDAKINDEKVNDEKVNEDEKNNKKVIKTKKESKTVKKSDKIEMTFNDNEIKYTIHPKILEFFNIENKKSIIELKELFLTYLINNNLIISHYFIIDDKMSKLLRNIKPSTIMNINEVDNLVSYFIKD